jgi:hypothetical protein
VSAYTLALVAHLLLFAYWLGGDLGVFYSSYVVGDPARPIVARQTAAGILVWLDRIPRVCLILMLPVSLSLVTAIGLANWPLAVLATVWGFAAAWLVLLWRVEATHAAALTLIDGLIRLVVIATLAVLGVATLTGAGPITGPWLGIKLLLFAITIASGLVIRRVFAPFGAAFARLASEGSTPEIEQAIDTSLRRTRPFVILIWVCLIAAAVVGVAKPAI